MSLSIEETWSVSVKKLVHQLGALNQANQDQSMDLNQWEMAAVYDELRRRIWHASS